MWCFCPETDLCNWLVQFTWECNIFTWSLKGVKFFFWHVRKAKEMILGLLFCSVYSLGMIDTSACTQILASEKGFGLKADEYPK